MGTPRAAVDAELMLERDHIDVAKVEEVGRAAVRLPILFGDLEPDVGRVVVSPLDIVHGHDEAFGVREFRDGTAQVVSEGRNAALAWRIVADKGDSLNIGLGHRGLSAGVRSRAPVKGSQHRVT
jgi:hypothetical protein